ncbi:MAG: ATP-binding cassette domain-containing protein [Deltaproteobacteria bacterium]|nr:ATP-binding cassette domain-containing protein [Deltaproteobacteria bacterium]
MPLEHGVYRIGSSRVASIAIAHPSVAKLHLELRVSPAEIVATDLGAGTTRANGRLLRGSVAIDEMTKLSVGEVLIELHREVSRPEVPSTINALTSRVGLIEGSEAPTVEGDLASALPSRERMVLMRDTSLAALGSAPTEDDLREAELASFLAVLDPVDRRALQSAAERVEVPPGTVRIREGELVAQVEILLSGQLKLSARGRALGTLVKGEALGLRSVLRGIASPFTVITDEGATVLRIPSEVVRKLLAVRPSLRAYFERVLEWPGAERLRLLLVDYDVRADVVVRLVASLRRRAFSSGQTVVSAGESPRAVFIVDEGAVEGLRGTRRAVELSTGSIFGAAELVRNEPLALDYRTTRASVLLDLDRATIFEAMGESRELGRLLQAFSPPREKTRGHEGDEPPDDDDEAPPLSSMLKAKSPPPKVRPRVLSIRQNDEMDCGAACLATISHSYGRRIGVPFFRSLVHVTREGASMWSLVKAARRTGFEVVGVQSSLSAMKKAHLPAILLLKYHFVVVFSIREDHVVLADPAMGVRKLSHEDLAKDWNGMALLLRPTDRFFEHPESAPSYGKYRSLLAGLWKPSLEILLASFVVFLLGLGAPLLSQVVFDRVLVTEDRSLLNVVLIFAATVAMFQVGAGAIRTNLSGFVANRCEAAFSALVYRHIMSLPLGYFIVRRVGDFLTRLKEIQKIRQFLTGDSLTALIQAFSVLLYLWVLYLYDPRLAWSSAAFVPVVGIISAISARALERALKDGFPSMARAQGLMVEQVRSLETIKVLSAELASRWRWEEAFAQQLSNRLRVERIQTIAGAFAKGAEQLATTGMIYYAAKLAISGELSLGKSIASAFFVSSIFGPVRDLATRWTSIQETRVALSRLDDIITAPAEPKGPARAKGSAKLKGDIVFDDVWFQYGSDLSPWVLKGVSLEIRRGETVAFVGRSGSGKTTLVQLINLLYRPTRGRILLDGVDATELPLSQIRDSVGVVLQDTQLFSTSVFENIAMGKEGATLELCVAAARVANAHGFISTLKGGYHAHVGDGGRRFSGGQRQRIAIARALFRRPSVLLLDEATSALDSESERAIVDGMKTFCRGRTSIIVAHRLSTIVHADKIVMMEAGRIVEVGSHKTLIERGGAYAQLFGAQLAL